MRATAANDKRDLWLRLYRYHFDHLVPSHLMDRVTEAFGGADASSKAFASKLGRKLGWRTPFALRAIAEYKKFVYLGLVSDFYVTPPKTIDMVWHEHLLFTRGYRDFCANVLGEEFDHAPELLPNKDQTESFQAQYHATLERYRLEFNAEPPLDIWGTPKFDPELARQATKKLKKRDRSSGYSDDTPVYMLFQGDSHEHGSGEHSGPAGDVGFGGFGDGGGFSGAGSSGSFGGDSHGDSGSSDSGSSDGGGSGCSSGCGGGGGD